MDQVASFAQALKQRRRALDLTQQQLAHQVGCAAVTIQRIEQGCKLQLSSGILATFGEMTQQVYTGARRSYERGERRWICCPICSR